MFTLFGEGWRTPLVVKELRISATTAATMRSQPSIAMIHEIGENLAAVHVANDSSLGDVHYEILTPPTMEVLALSMDAALGLAVRVVSKRK